MKSFRVLLIVLCTVGVWAQASSGAGKIYVVDPAGSGDFTSLAPAIARAQKGDTVVLKPGHYQEALVVPAGVTIRGSDKSRVRVDINNPWMLKGPGSFEISDLVFSGAGVRAENADSVTLTSDTFVSAQEATAVVLIGSHNVSISGCNFQGAAKTYGVGASGSDFAVSDSVFADQGSMAILVLKGSKAVLHKNLMQGNHDGIGVSDSTLNADHNIMTGPWDPEKENSAGNGIWAQKSAVKLDGNSVRRYLQGVHLDSGSAPAVMADNTVTENEHAVVLLGMNASLTKNLIIQNEGDGVYIGMPAKQKQTSAMEVTLDQNTISQNGTAVDVGTFQHVTLKTNLIEANGTGIRTDAASLSIFNNTIVLQKSTAINLERGTNVQLSDNIVAFNAFGIFAHVQTHREGGHNDVFGNLVSTDFPLHDGNYGRSDYFTTRDNRKVPIEVYPAYDMKASSDVSVDPGFTKMGSDYTLKPTSALLKMRGEDGKLMGAYANPSAPAAPARAGRAVASHGRPAATQQAKRQK